MKKRLCRLSGLSIFKKLVFWSKTAPVADIYAWNASEASSKSVVPVSTIPAEFGRIWTLSFPYLQINEKSV